MHLVSTINPLSKSEGNIPVTVFCYNEQQKFLRVSEDYEDTILRVREAFDIENGASLSLQTASLDVCKGRNVEIDESAYPLMWTTLDEVNVVIGGSIGGKADRLRLSNTAATSLPTPAKTPTVGGSSTSNSDVETEERGQTAPPASSSVDVIPNRKDEKGKEREQEQEQEPKTTNAYDRDRETYEARVQEEEEEESRTWNFRDKPTGGDKGEGRSNVRQKFKPVSNLFPLATSTESLPQVNKEKITSSPNSYTTNDLPSAVKSPRKENLGAAGSNAADQDPRFEISIIGPEPNQIAQFKTRGKHAVRKVLAAACKSFDVDYERSHLFLAVSVEDEDGKMQTHEFECAEDDTMSRCGVDENSRLFVKVDPDEGEDDELHDSD